MELTCVWTDINKNPSLIFFFFLGGCWLKTINIFSLNSIFQIKFTFKDLKVKKYIDILYLKSLSTQVKQSSILVFINGVLVI